MSINLLRWQMIRGLFWRPSAIIPGKQTIAIIDPMYRPPEKNLIVNPAYCLADFVTQMADVNIDIIHYPQAHRARVKRHDPCCILISGQTAPWTDYKLLDLEAVFNFVRETEAPLFGICGGHQIIAQAFGSPVAPMGFKELGYTSIELAGSGDPLFDGLSSPLTVFNVHGEEIKEMPADFELLGSSKRCRIQIMRHREKDISSVQFHPELSGYKPDGIVMLTNFLRRAGVILKTED